jgi:hypothetical protein
MGFLSRAISPVQETDPPKGEAMLRLALLVLHLFAPFSVSVDGGWGAVDFLAPLTGELHGNLDPNGGHTPAAGDIGGGLDPDGSKFQAPSTGDIGGGSGPNG